MENQRAAIDRSAGCRAATAGVAIESIDPGTILDVMTWHTRYRLIILDGEGRAVVTGGTRFQQPTEVRVEGSTAGGRDFRTGWIGVGLRLELSLGPRTITTSPIQSVESVEPVAA